MIIIKDRRVKGQNRGPNRTISPTACEKLALHKNLPQHANPLLHPAPNQLQAKAKSVKNKGPGNNRLT